MSPTDTSPLTIETLFAQAGTDAERARLLNDKALEIEEDDPIQMLELARRAREFAARSGDRIAWAFSCRHAGIAQHRLGFTTEALADLQAAFDQFTELGNKQGAAQVLSAIASVHQDDGRHDRALEYQLHCLQLVDELGDEPAKARMLLSTAEIYCSLGEEHRALECCEQCLAIARIGDDRRTLGTALANLGSIYARMGQFDRALQCQQDALAIKEESGNTLGVAIGLGNIAALHVVRNEPEEAIGMYELSLRLREDIGDRRGIATVLRNLGDLHYDAGKHDRSLECLNRALIIAEELSVGTMQLDLHADCARVHEAMGNFSAALYHFKQSVSFREESVNRAKLQQVVALELEYDRAHDRAVHDHLRHRVYDLEHLALRSQINPHFLFNALNAIQFFLTNNDRESAHRYLSKLARLMRASLEYAREPLVTLTLELEAVEMYLQLEQLRFGSRFTHAIEIDESLATDDIKVPPMVLQPFVENAVWHGLLPRPEAGNVRLMVRAEGTSDLLCVIEDDGIGREESAKRRSTENPSARHTSLGMRLIADRLSLLSERSGKHMNVTVIDLHDEAGAAAGTRVELLLPIDLTLFDVR